MIGCQYLSALTVKVRIMANEQLLNVYILFLFSTFFCFPCCTENVLKHDTKQMY